MDGDDIEQCSALDEERNSEKSCELKLKIEENDANILEVKELSKKVRQLELELEEARSQVMIAHCTAENEIAIEKRKCNEEVASVQQILKEDIEDLKYQLQLSRQEKSRYKDLYDKYSEDSLSRKDSSSGVLSAVTKSFTKRVPSLSPSHTASSPYLEKSGRVSPGATVSPGCSPASTLATSLESQESLEESMRRAQGDAAVLRSLVEPLEEEIRALKDKIREQDNKLQAYEFSLSNRTEALVDISGSSAGGKSADELVLELDEKLKSVKHTLETEKESRADLELYTSLLTSQKGSLSNSVDYMQSQLVELKRLYVAERKENEHLKVSWRNLNDQFLVAQRGHLEDMRRIKLLFTPEQSKKLSEMEKLECKSEIPESVTADPENPTNCPNDPCPRGYGRISPLSLDRQSSSSLQETLEDPKQESGNSDNTSSSRVDISGEESSAGSSSAAADERLVGDVSAEALLTKYCSDSMPQLTDDQKKALSEIAETPVAFNISLENDSSPAGDHPSDDACPQPGSGVEPPPSARRLVSDEEWLKLQDDVAEIRRKMLDSCPSCARSEADSKKFQAELREAEKERDSLSAANARLQNELDRETDYRRNTENRFHKTAQSHEKNENELRISLERATARYSQVVSWSKKRCGELETKLADFMRYRTEAHAEMTRLQRENDLLVGKHSQHSLQMQNEVINLPDTMEDMQLLLLRNREDLISAKVAKEAAEEKLKSELAFMKDQILKEQHEWNVMEKALTHQNDSIRKKMMSLEKRCADLVSEKESWSEAELRLKEAGRDAQIMIETLKIEVADLSGVKARQDDEIAEWKKKWSTLQHDFKTSEDVQRDFVRLSQSLQVKLEELRQAESEVRWQHEDDVDDCNHCKQKFASANRRKGHCRHCGKIFCSDCLTKTVRSGPKNRTSRVCDVCHTLLVQDATPFWSKEPKSST